MGICQYQRPDKSDVGIFKKIAIRRQAPVEDRFRETGEKDMRYDFTKIIDRHGKDAIAVDGLGKNPGFAPEPPKDGFDVIPMWVADMNFETVPTIPKAIMDRAAHPAYGYFSPVEEYYDSIIRWHKIRNNVEGLMPEYIGYENGVLGGVICSDSFCRTGRCCTSSQPDLHRIHQMHHREWIQDCTQSAQKRRKRNLADGL